MTEQGRIIRLNPLQRKNLDLVGVSTSDFICWKCKSIAPTVDVEWSMASLQTKAERFGLLTELNQHHEDYKVERNNNTNGIIEKQVERMEKVLDDSPLPNSIFTRFKNTDPKPYPNITPMSDASLSRHSICGRRFELSMLLFNVNQCTCCGRIEPMHIDPLFPSNPIDVPFERTHFKNNFHAAYLCKCADICKGGQFYSFGRPSQKMWYEMAHKRKLPKESNALLCQACYSECAGKDNVDDLRVGRKFSDRNGFGPVNYISEKIAHEYSYDKNYAISRELQLLLLSFTCVEEAAIRTIVPLLSIVRLMHGSIKSKGNTSCVWQKSQLCLVLPNLPSECKYIVINC